MKTEINLESLKEMSFADYKKALKKDKKLLKKARGVMFIQDHKFSDGKKALAMVVFKKPKEVKTSFKALKSEGIATPKMAGGNCKIEKGENGPEFKYDIKMGGLKAEKIEVKGKAIFESLLGIIPKFVSDLFIDEESKETNDQEEPSRDKTNKDGQLNQIKRLIKEVAINFKDKIKVEVVAAIKDKTADLAHLESTEQLINKIQDVMQLAKDSSDDILTVVQTQVAQIQALLPQLEKVKSALDQLLESSEETEEEEEDDDDPLFEIENEEKGTKTGLDISEEGIELSHSDEKKDTETTVGYNIEDNSLEISHSNENTEMEVTANINFNDGSAELGLNNEETGTETKITTDFKKGELGLTSENEEKGTSFEAMLDKNGITAGYKKSIDIVDWKGKALGPALFKGKPSFKLGAEVSIAAAITREENSITADLAVNGSIGLELYVNLALVEFGGKIALNGGVDTGAKIYLDGEKLMLQVKDTEITISGSIEFFIRPGQILLDLIDFIREFLDEESEEPEYDEEEAGWRTDPINLGELKIILEGTEIELLANTGLDTNSNLPQIIENALANSKNGFIKTLIKIKEIIDDIVKFIEDAAEAVSDFFDGIGEAIGTAWDDVRGFFDSEVEERIQKERMREALYSTHMMPIFEALIRKMKEDPKHVKALSKKPSDEDKNLYIFLTIWPQAISSPTWLKAIKAVENLDFEELDKIKRVAEGKFEISRLQIDGEKADNGEFIMGYPLEIALDLRKDEEWMSEMCGNLAKMIGVEMDDKLSTKLNVSLYCGDQLISTKTEDVKEIIDVDAKMSNAYNYLLDLPADKGLGDSTQKNNWYVLIKIDFDGNVFDIEKKVPIKVIYDQAEEENPQDQIPENLAPTLPKITGLSIKGDKQKNMFLQKQNLTVLVRVAADEIEGFFSMVKAEVDVTVLYNGKRTHKPQSEELILSADEQSKLVRISVPIKGGNYKETQLDGKWRVRIRLRSEGMEAIKKYKTIAVVNPDRQQSLGDPQMSYVNDDEE